jgi:hypothetical protein
MSVHTGRLLVGTQDPFLLPSRTRVRAALTEAGFLGTPVPGRDGAFSVGERFFQLVTFAGCSVQVELSAVGDRPFCHILLAGPFEHPRFLSGRNTRPPRCSACRSPLKDYKQILAAGKEDARAATPCPTCGRTAPLWTYDWREKAGFGRLFIQVEEIFPGEAVPTPGLLTGLARCTGCAWRHFYIQDFRLTPSGKESVILKGR